LFCSFGTGAVLFFFSLRSLPASGQGRFEGYAALALEESAPDREIAGALEAALGRPVVSESSQWVLLNSFEGLEQVPLELYKDRLEAFDPRRDGYAEKLMNFFVRDGWRWFFIPLDGKLFDFPPALNPGKQLKKRIGAALDTARGPGGVSIPFSLLMKPQAQPRGFRILLFVLAWAAALVFPPGNRRFGAREVPRGGRRFRRFFRWSIPPERRRLLLLAPLMSPLSLWGAPGFAFIALSLFLGTLLADPLKECWVRLLGKGLKPAWRAGPYSSRFFYSLPLALFLALIPWIGAMPPLLVFLNFLGFSLFYFISLGLEIRRKFSSPSGGRKGLYGPCRFVSLPILPPRFFSAKGKPGKPGSTSLSFPGRRNRGGLVLPFALASCLAAFSGSLGGNFGFSFSRPPNWPFLVGEEDYRAHALFQAGFALRSLQTGAVTDPGYFRYTLGEDGLVAGVLPLNPEGPEIPPFPLADLTNFLAAWGSGDPGIRGFEASRWPVMSLADWLSPLLAFLLIFPTLAGRDWKKVPAYYDKRVAA
jgi:hypothetical protein